MNKTVFTEVQFWLLVAFSVVIPSCIYDVLLLKRAISRTTVLVFGFTLVAIAGIDVYLLKNLAELAKFTPSLADDAVFVSEVSIALYLVPAMFGGIGINIVSHILVSHLVQAERQFEKENPAAWGFVRPGHEDVRGMTGSGDVRPQEKNSPRSCAPNESLSAI